ncbi:hypothetical protein [Hydrogenoanaerobacterium sp.]|uniref:hypothetical protein n=1 Tax=Hydrogenoanaerobacterium sp. TaxID=2953763 RepID=UPI0028986888|nr:hypothetical protein [Hydrogenoanaerobacterium sp.]
MSKQKEEYYWHRLDNAAKVFPAVRSSSNSSVFRITAKLVDEIAPSILTAAVEKALAELPTFHVKLRKGLFWYYWERNFQSPIIVEDSTYPLRRIDKRQSNGFMFRVTYYGRKINLEIFHALTDGAGAMVLLKSIVYFYLKQCHPDVITVNELIAETGFSQHALDEDSFLRLRKGSKRSKSPKVVPAYQMKGTRYFGERVDVTQGILPTMGVVALAKAAGVTVTVYLTSLLMYSIYQNNYKYYAEDKPIVFSVPVNLRGFFQSNTIRNFFSFVTVSLNFYEQDYTFEQVLESISHQMKDALKVENLTERIAYNVNAERNLAIRFIPLFLKNILLRAIYSRGEKGYTSTISNLGQIKLPQEQLPFVERFESLNNLTKHQCFKVCLCSLRDYMTVSFVSGMEDKDVERYFFRFLAEKGLDVQIAGNKGDEDEIL